MALLSEIQNTHRDYDMLEKLESKLESLFYEETVKIIPCIHKQYKELEENDENSENISLNGKICYSSIKLVVESLPQIYVIKEKIDKNFEIIEKADFIKDNVSSKYMGVALFLKLKQYWFYTLIQTFEMYNAEKITEFIIYNNDSINPAIKNMLCSLVYQGLLYIFGIEYSQIRTEKLQKILNKITEKDERLVLMSYRLNDLEEHKKELLGYNYFDMLFKRNQYIKLKKDIDWRVKNLEKYHIRNLEDYEKQKNTFKHELQLKDYFNNKIKEIESIKNSFEKELELYKSNILPQTFNEIKDLKLPIKLRINLMSSYHKLDFKNNKISSLLSYIENSINSL